MKKDGKGEEDTKSLVWKAQWETELAGIRPPNPCRHTHGLPSFLGCVSQGGQRTSCVRIGLGLVNMQICGSIKGLKNQNLRELDQGMCNFLGGRGLHCDTCGILVPDKRPNSLTPSHTPLPIGILESLPLDLRGSLGMCILAVLAWLNCDFAGGRWGLYFKQAPQPFWPL